MTSARAQRILSSTFAATLFAASVFAGDEDAPDAEFTFRTAGLTDSDEVVFIAAEEKDAAPVTLNFEILERSPDKSVKTSTLILLRKGSDDEMEKVTEITLSEKHPTLIVRVPPKEDEDFSSYYALPDPLADLYGTYRAVNLTGNDLKASLDEVEIEVASDSNVQLGSKFTDSDPDPAPYQLWRPVDEHQEWIERKTVKPHRDKYLLLFYHAVDPKARRLRANTYGIAAFRPTK